MMEAKYAWEQADAGWWIEYRLRKSIVK